MAQGKTKTADVKAVENVETADLEKKEKAAELVKNAAEKKETAESKAKVRFEQTHCASYGSFQLGDVGFVPASCVKELEKNGIAKPVKE